jgi:anti-anti-sigma regulatory factor
MLRPQKLGAGIKLANLSPRLKDVLQITKLLTVFEVFDRAEEAAAVFNPTAGQSKPEE